MTRDMNQDVFINKLLELGVIVRVRRGWYIIPAYNAELAVDRRYICRTFGIEVGEGRGYSTDVEREV